MPCPACRTRKSAADAAAELASKQLALSAASSQVAAAQSQLEALEGSLAAKRKELGEVLGQLQAAAVQEFQDAKKLLLEEGEACWGCAVLFCKAGQSSMNNANLCSAGPGDPPLKVPQCCVGG